MPQQIFVYGDSLSWGIIPGTRHRLPFERRWPGVMEHELTLMGRKVRVLEDCLNGRRTAWEDPFKPGRRGIDGIEVRMEAHAPLALAIVALGTNDFQSVHDHNAWHSAQGLAALVRAMRQAPIEPGMPVPPILIVAPPPVREATGPMSPKFAGARERALGVAAAYAQVAAELGCAFFDAGQVIWASELDGVHIDGEQHAVLGHKLAAAAAALLPG